MRLLFLIVGVLAILIEDIPCYAKSDSRLEVAVTVNSNYRGESPENLPFIQKAAEEAGVSVEWQVYDQKNWQEQFQLKIEEEKQPDIFINCITETDFAEYKDKFMELDQLIENEAPDIMKAYQEDPLLRVYSTQEDGHIYGLAVKRPYRPYIWKKWIINKNWLDRLDMEVPETWEELKTVLKAFRDKDANGNGDPNDEIPLVFNNVLQYSYIIMGGGGRYCDVQGLSCCDGQFLYLPTTDDWRMTVEFLHELYEEELLYKESISMSYSMLQSLGQNEDVPIVGASICWSPNEIVGPEWEEQYVVMDQLMAQDGIEAVYSYQIYDNMTYSKHRAHISANCKDPKAAIRFLNLFYREDYSVQSYYGSFGVGVQADEKLHYEVLVPEESSDEGWQRRYSMVDNGIYYFAEELENRIDPPESILKLLEDETGKKTVAPEDGEAVERIHLKNSEIIEADRIQRSLENLSLKALAEFLSEGISDEAWERFQQKLKAAEVDSLVDIYETAQNREYG